MQIVPCIKNVSINKYSVKISSIAIRYGYSFLNYKEKRKSFLEKRKELFQQLIVQIVDT